MLNIKYVGLCHVGLCHVKTVNNIRWKQRRQLRPSNSLGGIIKDCFRPPVFLCLGLIDSCGALPQWQQLHGLHLLGYREQRLQPELVSERVGSPGALQQAGSGEVHGRVPTAGGTGPEPEHGPALSVLAC